MRYDRIGPEHDPRPVAPAPARPGLLAMVLQRLLPGREPPAAPARPVHLPATAGAERNVWGEAPAAFLPRSQPLFRPFLADPRPVLYGAADPAAELPATTFLQTAGLDVVTCTSLRSTLARAHGQPMGWSTLILAIDGFGGPRLVADGLLSLRRKLPHLPVILVSEEVQFHDFSAERAALCDITLRAPLSAPALELGMAEAGANNLIWQARVAAMRTEA